MKKTLDDYMNDPDLANEPSALREVHAIRLMIQDETKGMTAVQASQFLVPPVLPSIATIGTIEPKKAIKCALNLV